MIYDIYYNTETDSVTKSYYKKRQQTFDINSYINDGFEKVCDVLCTKTKEWYYSNINSKLMFSEHNSWVYFLVIDDSIVKCGETGNPLGIPSRTTFLREQQPASGTKSRFGRLRTGDGTDKYLRENTVEYVLSGSNISLWAKKCPKTARQVTVAGQTFEVYATMHKDLEMLYLDYFKHHAGCLPLFNKATK
jgi:hypothetical protein